MKRICIYTRKYKAVTSFISIKNDLNGNHGLKNTIVSLLNMK